MSVFIVAEAGVNHNGSLDMAKRLIDVAADAGVNAVKFQTFRAERLVSKGAPKTDYQLQNTEANESQLDMLRKLELSEADHAILIAHATVRGVVFLSTPFDFESLVLLTERFALSTIKIPSGEITNAPFLLQVAQAAQKIILSTGMSTLKEVETALGVLAFGFVAPAGALPGREAFVQAFASEAGKCALCERVTLLHCTTEYPAPFSAVNLRAMEALKDAFGLPVGYSDHTSGIHVAIAATALGATMLEKHFTLDRALPGPDHRASLEPTELKAMVHFIREIEQALGDGIKQPAVAELRNREIIRKSLVAARNITAGEMFSEQNVTCKRPGNGLAPIEFWRVAGMAATRSYAKDENLDA